MSILEKIAKEKTISSSSTRKYEPLPPRNSAANNNNSRAAQSPAPSKVTPKKRTHVTKADEASFRAYQDPARMKARQAVSRADRRAGKGNYDLGKSYAKNTNAAPKMSAGKRFSQRLNPAQRTYFNKLYKSDPAKFRSEIARFNRSKGKFSMEQIAAKPAPKTTGAQMVQRYYPRRNFTPMKRPQMGQRYYRPAPRPDSTPMTRPQTSRSAPAAKPAKPAQVTPTRYLMAPSAPAAKPAPVTPTRYLMAPSAPAAKPAKPAPPFYA